MSLSLSAVSGSSDAPVRPKGSPAPASESAPGALNIAELGKALENLGYAVEPIIDKDGKTTAYKATFEANGWNYTLIIEISPNGQFIWVTAPLEQVNPGSIASEQLMKILAANARIEPAFFVIDEQSHILMMQMPISNKNVTQATLRQWINYFCKSVRDTKDVWTLPLAEPKTAPGFPSD